MIEFLHWNICSRVRLIVVAPVKEVKGKWFHHLKTIIFFGILIRLTAGVSGFGGCGCSGGGGYCCFGGC